MNQETKGDPVAVPASHQSLDLLRTVFFNKIAEFYMTTVLSYDSLPKEMNRNVVRDTVKALERCNREIQRVKHTPHDRVYLERNMKEAKILDLCTIADLMARIGAEENGSMYDEFLGLLVDALDGIFYMQKNRRKMHFPKYKALFKLISEEMLRDTNGQPSQVLFTRDGDLFLRTGVRELKQEVKK